MAVEIYMSLAPGSAGLLRRLETLESQLLKLSLKT